MQQQSFFFDDNDREQVIMEFVEEWEAIHSGREERYTSFTYCSPGVDHQAGVEKIEILPEYREKVAAYFRKGLYHADMKFKLSSNGKYVLAADRERLTEFREWCSDVGSGVKTKDLLAQLEPDMPNISEELGYGTAMLSGVALTVDGLSPGAAEYIAEYIMGTGVVASSVEGPWVIGS